MSIFFVKNENRKYDKYKKSNNISLKKDELYSFILTKDDKEIILAKYYYIYFYQTKPFQLIILIKEVVGDTKKKRLYLIDEYTFRCDNRTT